MSGNCTNNGSYLPIFLLSSFQIQLNGNIITSLSPSFSLCITNVIQHTLTSNGNVGENLLFMRTFREGKIICFWDLRPSDLSDTLSLELSGNLC